MAANVGQVTSRLFYARDRINNTRFLIDTGAVVSVISPARTDLQNCDKGPTLQAVNSTIPTFGQRSLALDIMSQETIPVDIWYSKLKICLV